jgi:hypothetical protein
VNRTDTLGYNFEMDNIECLKGNGYGKYIKFANPSNTWAWKRKRELGVDMVIGLGEDIYYIEESFCSYDYKLSQSWFDNCRLPRFRDYPCNQQHHHIILTNRPQNFAGLVVGSVQIVTISWLLRVLGDYDHTTSIPILNNTNGYGNEPSDEEILTMLKEVVRPKWIDERLKQLENGVTITD